MVGSSFEVYVEQYQEEIYSRKFISLDSYNKTLEKGISPYSKWADALVKACVYWETAMDALGNELPSDYTVVAAPDGISLKLVRLVSFFIMNTLENYHVSVVVFVYRLLFVCIFGRIV